jgi:hypothetical protein
MNSKIYDLLKSLKEQLSEVEKNFLEQQKKLELTRLERDIHKEILKEIYELTQNVPSYTQGSNVLYMNVYSCDNGEGVDTDECIGVFTKKSKAMQATVDVCMNNTELDSNGFIIVEVKVDKKIVSDDTVYVIKQDEEAHCEISTTILDVKINNKNDDYKDSYSVEYTVDKVYHIEE